MTAVVISLLLIMRQYTDYLINGYTYEFSWFAISSRILINYLLWSLIATFLLFPLSERFLDDVRWSTVLRLLLLSFIVALVHRIVSIRLTDFVYYVQTGYLREFLSPSNRVQLGAGWITSFIEFWMIIAVLLMLSYAKRYVEKDKALSTAQLNALKMQLQPHFLFNTLNSIASLIDLDPKKAQKMLAELGFLMRQMLEHDEKQMIPFEHELSYVKSYLEIEQIRFQDRLTVDYQVDEETLQVEVPALILQPLVENAIKHGISSNPDGGSIQIAASNVSHETMPYIELEVINDFQPHRTRRINGYGIGTKNIAKRLEQHYGKNHVYEQGTDQNKFTATLKFPINL